MRHVLRFFVMLAFSLPFISTHVHAEVIDRVVAYVDTTAITLSEFQEIYDQMKTSTKVISPEEAINSMINRLLLLKEARKMRLDAPTTDEAIKDYIDIKIRGPILIKEDEIERFYMEHRDEFKGKELSAVRDEIEKYLFELETNSRLKRHLEDLRAKAEIRIQLTPQ